MESICWVVNVSEAQREILGDFFSTTTTSDFTSSALGDEGDVGEVGVADSMEVAGEKLQCELG